jgi:hypothetical protein
MYILRLGDQAVALSLPYCPACVSHPTLCIVSRTTIPPAVGAIPEVVGYGVEHPCRCHMEVGYPSRLFSPELDD